VCGGLYSISGDVVIRLDGIDERRRAGREQPSVDPFPQEPQFPAPAKSRSAELALLHT
jgi:hypothetical protein